MSGVHVGARVSRELADALESASREANTSKSELIRHYLIEGILESDADLPPHILQEVKRERLKRKNRLTWQRVHFPSNVADRFRRAFEQGDLDGSLNPGAIEDIREIHIEDAKLLFEDEPERRETAIEYVNGLAEHAKQASDASEFDRLNPEEMFENYSGVEEARAIGSFDHDEYDAIVEDARSRLSDPTKAVKPDDPGFIKALSKIHDAPEGVVEDAVTEAARGGDQ